MFHEFEFRSKTEMNHMNHMYRPIVVSPNIHSIENLFYK